MESKGDSRVISKEKDILAALQRRRKMEQEREKKKPLLFELSQHEHESYNDMKLQGREGGCRDEVLASIDKRQTQVS